MRARLSEEELARRLEIYAGQEVEKGDPLQPSYSEAMYRLVRAGCDPEILLGLARAHCLSPLKITADLLSPELTKFANSLDRANTDFWALVDKIGSFGCSADQVARILSLERLIPLFATCEYFRNLSKLRFHILNKVRIYEPLLCVYVRQVTGKDDYAAIAAIYRGFYYAAGVKSKKDIGEAAPRIADARYLAENDEAYAALERAVTNYRNVASSARGQRPPHYVLLVFAHIEMGNLLTHPSSEIS